MHSEEIQYSAAGANCHGTVCYDSSATGKKPAIIIVHAFEGKTQEYVRQAQEMAKLGYVGIAVDMYGDGQTATDLEGCMALLTPVMGDRALCRQRLLDTYEWVKSLNCVDENQVAIMGYCFGGMCALDLARADTPIKAAISAHGTFNAPEGLNCHVSSKVLILHGYEDPQIPFSDFTTIAAELDGYGADWQAHFYSHTKHAFTDPHAERIAPEIGREYSPVNCKRAWQSSVNLLAEVFKNQGLFTK
jgi:dienelactone hydrolase